MSLQIPPPTEIIKETPYTAPIRNPGPSIFEHIRGQIEYANKQPDNTQLLIETYVQLEHLCHLSTQEQSIYFAEAVYSVLTEEIFRAAPTVTYCMPVMDILKFLNDNGYLESQFLRVALREWACFVMSSFVPSKEVMRAMREGGNNSYTLRVVQALLKHGQPRAFANGIVMINRGKWKGWDISLHTPHSLRLSDPNKDLCFREIGRSESRHLFQHPLYLKGQQDLKKDLATVVRRGHRGVIELWNQQIYPTLPFSHPLLA